MSGQTSRRWNLVRALNLLARCMLGLAFVYSGWNKAWHPVDFLKLLRQYEFTQNYLLLNSLAAVLPWFEIFCGLLLLAGLAVRGTALLLGIMLAVFTGVVLDRALHLMTVQAIPFTAVKFDCGCGTGEMLAWQKLLFNLGLIVLAVWLLAVWRKTQPGRPDR